MPGFPGSTNPNYRHGHSQIGKRTAEYRSWAAMIARCTCPSQPCYYRYGGRGITVCQRWLDSFQAFYSDMGDKPTPAHTLDRIDGNGDYCPENCRWATRKEQGVNRDSTIYLELNGVRLTIEQWAKRLNIKRNLIKDRYHRGWLVERILTQPARRSPTNAD